MINHIYCLTIPTTLNPLCMLRAALIVGISVSISAPVYAQHLGLRAGDSIQTVRSKTSGLTAIPDDPGRYSASKLPQNPPGNDGDYRLSIGKKTGLCQIVVFWQIENDSRYGDRVKAKFSELESALDKKYGSDGDKNKFVRSGALWDADNEFMMSLLEKDRFHSSYWSKKDGQRLPPETDIIGLQAVGLSTDDALIKLTYQFENNDRCVEEYENESNSML